MNESLELTSSGLYCREGDFYIDPWRSVKRAVITHAHADHAREMARWLQERGYDAEVIPAIPDDAMEIDGDDT